MNTGVQYGIISWGKSASCHQQPLSAVLNRAMRCLDKFGTATPEVASLAFITQRKSSN